MIRSILLSLLCFMAAVFPCSAQNIKYPVYDLQKDEPWIDSLKLVINKTTPNLSTTSQTQQQLLFARNCILLGSYYERLFDMRRLPDMKDAIFYYEKATQLNCSRADIHYHKILILIDSLNGKLEDIYFNGKGITKDKDKSFYIAYARAKGLPGRCRFYAERYFHTERIVLKRLDTLNFMVDSVFDFAVNPFVEESKMSFYKLKDPILTKLVLAFTERIRLEKLNMEVRYFPDEDNEGWHHILDNAMDVFLSFAKEKFKSDKGLIYSDQQFNWAGPESDSYLGISVPYIEVRFTKLPL